MEQIERIVVEIEEEFTRVKERREDLKRKAIDAGIKADESKKTKLQCEDTLNRMVPILNQAISSIDTIDKEDLSQLRSMNHPPKSIKIAFRIICIFLEVEPVPKMSSKTSKPKLSYWRAA